MHQTGFQSELAQQLRAWAEDEQSQDGRQGLRRLADEYEEIAAVSERRLRVAASEPQRQAA